MTNWHMLFALAALLMLGGCKFAGVQLWPEAQPPAVVERAPEPAPVPAPDPATPINTEDSTIFPQPKTFADKPQPLTLDGADAIADKPRRSAEQRTAARGAVPSAPGSAVADHVRLPAASVLAKRAERARAAGDEGQAAALYERALKLDNFDPWLLHGMALLRAAQRELRKARSLAARAQFLNRDDRELFARNADLLREINDALGLSR